MTEKNQKLTYDPSALIKKDIPARIEATVEEVNVSTLGELLSPDVLEKWNNADPNAPAIEVVARCSDGSVRRRTMQLPVDQKVHPSSNLAAWRVAYKAYPHVGQQIYLNADHRGFYQFEV